jgi:carboxylesterase type B
VWKKNHIFVRGANRTKPYIIGNNDKELGENTPMADAEFTCPSAQVANSRVKAGVPVWRYRFYGGGPFEGTRNAPATNPSAHAAELTYVWGYVGSGRSASTVTPQKIAVSDTFQKVWADFAKDPENGPIKNGWPKYDAKGDTLVRLMYKDETKISLTRGDVFDERCSIQICKNPKIYRPQGLKRN